MTCLSIIQSVSQELGITIPNAAVTSADPQVLQMVSLLNKEGVALAARPSEGWQALQMEATFTTVAAEIQTSVEAVAPNYKYIINNTIWNRAQRRPVFGPLTPQQWQAQKGWFTTGPYSQYRIVNGNIEFIPEPAAGEACAFEYATKAWVTDGSTTFTSFTTDMQYSLLDEELLKLGLIYRWKQVKGLDYSENKVEYEDRVNQAIARDTPKTILNMSVNPYRLPYLYVQDGSYPAG
jgi:hypothetical protein